MKILQEEETIPINSFSINYSIGNNPFTNYLQITTCQISVIVYIISFLLMKFKYKSGIDYLLSYHSIFLLLYSLFLFNNCILTIIDHVYFNYGLLCGLFFILTKQLFSTIIKFGMCLFNFYYSSKFVFYYSFAFFVFVFPFPIQYDLSYLQIGVLMLVGVLMYAQIDYYLKQLIRYLSEQKITDAKFTVIMGNMEQSDVIIIFIKLKQLVFSMLVVSVLMTTLFECLIFVHSMKFRNKIIASIECLEVLFVYWYYFVIMSINCSIYKEREFIIENNEGIELSQGNQNETKIDEDDEAEDEEWGEKEYDNNNNNSNNSY